MGPETTRLARVDPGPSQSYGVLSALLTVVGAALVVLAFTLLDWFEIDGGPVSKSTFSEVHKALDQVDGLAAGPAKLYFSWLGWALLAAAALIALAAAVPSLGALRVLGAIVALAALAATFVAIKLVKHVDTASADQLTYSDYLKHARFGFYFAVVGFLVIAVGAAIGPSRRRR
jgi:MFS family permease